MVLSAGPGACSISPVNFVEGMNGGFESWRNGPGDRASRGNGKTETQI
jgi:hypothetical protein